MKGRKTRWAVLAAMTLVGGMASNALGIEAFQERFEWGDLSKPTTLQARVAVVDPYDNAAWVNVGVFGGAAESGYYWQRYFPGKNLKVYAANDEVMNKFKEFGKGSHSQAVMTGTKPSKYTLVEIVVQETEQNHRVVTSVKAIDEVAGTPEMPRNTHSLRSTPVLKEIAHGSWPQSRKMLYDVLIPDGQAISGVIPYSDQGVGEVRDFTK